MFEYLKLSFNSELIDHMYYQSELSINYYS